MSELNNRLEKLNACPEAINWVGDKDLKQAWQECKRGDWMLWYYFKEVGFTKELVKAKADCASLVKHLMKDQRSLDALQACYDYADGKISKEELRRAADAAYGYATAAAAAAYAAADADATATAAYAAAADADATAYAAAYAAAYATAAADAAATRKETLKNCADICREVLTDSLFKNVGK